LWAKPLQQRQQQSSQHLAHSWQEKPRHSSALLNPQAMGMGVMTAATTAQLIWLA
jgi:hypothetical protein